MRKCLITILLSVAGVSFCFGQPECGYPDALVTEDGRVVSSAAMFDNVRRPEIVDIFASQVYGIDPGTKVRTKFDIIEERTDALGGKATRRQVRMTFSANGIMRRATMLIYIPNGVPKPVPVFTGLNFNGNYTTTPDPAVLLTDGWMRVPAETNRADESLRGTSASRWPYEMAVDRGYAVATICYGEFYPDFYPEQKEEVDPQDLSVLPMLYDGSAIPDEERMQAIGAWAWGLSRAMDYFERAKDLDASRVAVLGHSRLGKAALWAGVSDPRFAIVISNDSGCGGAAPSRCKTGETLERINTRFPHWFAKNYRKYNANEFALSVDQNLLIAAVAPRPVYVASASDDAWAHPEGEFTSASLAGGVYRLYGKIPLQDYGKGFPVANTSLPGGDVGYHLREGKHDITVYDWEQYLKFADKYFK